MKHRLAIVIPAYKDAFLAAALDSIAAQTCKNFTLYVGDDCSPYPLQEIVDRYRDRIDLEYYRFDSNLGSDDLVAQWERCIDLSHDEEYIWLFSDDDVMEPNCVEAFYRQLEQTEETYDLYHFDTNEIDESGNITHKRPPYPAVLKAYDYYKGKSLGRYRSYVVDNIFSRKVYEAKGGFKKFDLAWCSDVATWCIFCGMKGMCKVPNAHVLWRRSSKNITPDKSRRTSGRKLMAHCESLNWAYEYFDDEQDIKKLNRTIFIRIMRQYKPLVSKRCFNDAYRAFWGNPGHIENESLVRALISMPKPIYRMLQKLRIVN